MAAKPVASAQITERLGELYERLLPVDEERTDRYYSSGRGYYAPEEAGDERDRFAICLATVDGELYEVGDYAWPFPLHSIAKVSPMHWRSPTTVARTSSPASASSRAGTHSARSSSTSAITAHTTR